MNTLWPLCNPIKSIKSINSIQFKYKQSKNKIEMSDELNQKEREAREIERESDEYLLCIIRLMKQIVSRKEYEVKER